MNYDAVEIVKSVSAVEAGRVLGLEINHSSRCKCPFHGGKDYNMKLYNGDRGYYCFVCHERGDVIGLVQHVLGIPFQDAVKWLSDEFHLGVDMDKSADKKTLQRAKKLAKQRRELERQVQQTERNIFDTYLDACENMNRIERIIDELAPNREDEEWNETFCTALKLKAEATEQLKEAEDLMMGWKQ